MFMLLSIFRDDRGYLINICLKFIFGIINVEEFVSEMLIIYFNL